MRFLPTLHRYLLLRFIPPFLISFSVALFILVLEFLARYQQDIFGKGFPATVILKLFFFASATMVVMALPISVMLASLMTLGKLGENYELTTIKSSGISLLRFLLPLFLLGIALSLFCFWFASEMIPKANLKLYSLLYSIERAKPKFKLTPGIFNYSLGKYIIRAQYIHPNNRLQNILIYDHSQYAGNFVVITADSGRIFPNYDELILHVFLYNGYRYEEQQEGTAPNLIHPHIVVHFDSAHYRFDLTGFGLQPNDESLFASHHYMLNRKQLAHAIDSLKKIPDSIRQSIPTYFHDYFRMPQIREKMRKLNPNQKAFTDLKQFLYPYSIPQLIVRAEPGIRTIYNYLEFQNLRYKEQKELLVKYQIQYYMKWMYGIACFLFLIIGAPLGSIIRKGGIGVPTIFSILFFILFYVLMTQGQKLAREGIISAFHGVWLPVYVLLPVAALVLYQAIHDYSFLRLPKGKLFQWLSKLRLVRSNVS